MAKTRLRVLDGEVIEFYESGNTVQFKLGASSTSAIRLTSNRINTAPILELNNINSGKSVGIDFLDAGTLVWDMVKDSSNNFSIKTSTNLSIIQIVNSTNNLILQGDAAGNVGIGKTPTSTLDIAGVLSLDNAGENKILFLNNTSPFQGSIYVKNEPSLDGEGFRIFTRSAAGADVQRLGITSAVATAKFYILNSLLGVGINTPTSGYVHIAANTTTVAPLRFTSSSSSLLTSVTADCVEYDGNSLFFTLSKTLRHSFNGTIFINDADAGPSGSGTETSLLASSANITWETLTIPANYMTAGKTMKLKAWGYYTSNTTTTYRLKFYFGSNLIADTGTFTPPAAATRKFWKCELLLGARNIGATARFTPDITNAWDVGALWYDSSGTLTNKYFTIDGTGTNDNFDATVSNVIDLKCTMTGTYNTAEWRCVTAVVEFVG